MKRIQKKVKDIVEVRSYKSLRDFLSKPGETLSSYHFTDFTSDLMTKFLDKLAAVQKQNGAACALAGYRGVGKSHFLATFGAIVSHFELRAKVLDRYVETGTHRLKRTNYPVAYVRRGTHDSLFEEFKEAIAKTFQIEAANLNQSLPDLLKTAVEIAGEVPLVVIVDTAFERSARVSRDDGALLGEIADLAKNLNLFVAVALDDDITDADGTNVAITKSFSIDYLDQEHLYRIVDKHIFQKQMQTQSDIHEIYTNFREVLPHFRWSEQRFASLYPLHPIILEIAPFVRLYVPDFALLGFASETGGKILGRPANSLIALDEVFDSVETALRKIEDLSDVFSVYDQLNSEVIAQIPVFQRLQAKLVLKALFLLSLKGEGATAGEISAAMLIYTEGEPRKAVQMVEELLEKFVSVFPEGVRRTAEENREVRYGFEINAKDNLNAALTEAAKTVSSGVIPKILRSVARNKFTDWTISEEKSGKTCDFLDCEIEWRGSIRRGRLFWNFENNVFESEASPESAKFQDWEIAIVSQLPDTSEEKIGTPKVFWQPSVLTSDEKETILKYYVLLTNSELRQAHGEQLRVAGQTYANAVEKIWNRIFLEEGKIFIDGFDYNFTGEAGSYSNLSEILSKILDPLFEARYPEHPTFVQKLGEIEVSILVNDFFSGARQNLAEAQKLAEVFALPLGLVTLRGDVYVTESEENLLKLSCVQEIFSLINDIDETISLEQIHRNFRETTVGLGREAQQLILTALVAQRQIEFVTSSGNRINRRSLDLRIIWNDIEAVGKPTIVTYSNERLCFWAKTLTDSDAIQSIETPDERQTLTNSLSNWLIDWKASRILERFRELPDEILNTKIWRIATQTEKRFGSVAETIAAILEENVSLEGGLHRIADAFSDSEKEFSIYKNELKILGDFISGARNRREIWNYLAICETTERGEIEALREKLFQLIAESAARPDENLNLEMETHWQSFHTSFSEYFVDKHDSVMRSSELQEKFAAIVESDDWWQFENLSQLGAFQQHYWRQAREICREIKDLECRFNTGEMLKTQPFCACSFGLEKIEELKTLPQKLEETLKDGLNNLRKEIKILRPSLIKLIEQFSAENQVEEFAQSASKLKRLLESGEDFTNLSISDFSILKRISETIQIEKNTQNDLQTGVEFLSYEELLENIDNSLRDVSDEALLETNL